MFVAASLHHSVAVETARIPIAWVLIVTTTSIPTTPALDANNPTTRSRAAHEQALDHEHALARGAARASSGSLRSIKRRSAAGAYYMCSDSEHSSAASALPRTAELPTRSDETTNRRHANRVLTAALAREQPSTRRLCLPATRDQQAPRLAKQTSTLPSRTPPRS
jgi:hypothetical protein